MEHAFVDADVAIDLLSERIPHYHSAASLFVLADQNKIKLYISSLSINNIHYILCQGNSEAQVRKALGRFKVLVNVLAVDDKIVELALASSFKDFEDAIQYYTAIENGLKLILTRNLRDYSLSKIPVMTPENYLKTRI